MARLAYLCLTGALGQQYGGYSMGYSSAPSYGYSSAPSYGYSSAPSSWSMGGGGGGGGGGWYRSSYGGGGGYTPPQQPQRRRFRPQRLQRRTFTRPQRTYTPPQRTYTPPQYPQYTWQPEPTYIQSPPPPPPRTYRPPPPPPQRMFKYGPPAPQEDEGGYYTHTVIGSATRLSKPTIERKFNYQGAKTKRWVGGTKTKTHQDMQYLGTQNTQHVGAWGETKENNQVGDWQQTHAGEWTGQMIKKKGASMDKNPNFSGFSDNVGWTIRTGPAQQAAAYEAAPVQQAPSYQPAPVQQAPSYQPAPAYGDYQAAEPVEEYSEPAYGAPSYGAQVEEPPAQYDAPASYGSWTE